MKSIKALIGIGNDFGWKWFLQRGVYELQLRACWHARKLPQRKWRATEYENWLSEPSIADALLDEFRGKRPGFLFAPDFRTTYGDVIVKLHQDDQRSLRSLQKPLTSSDVKYYCKHDVDLEFPGDWFRNPLLPKGEGRLKDEKLHWSMYLEHGEPYIDLKHIWESGRFNLVYLLVRNYAVTGNERNPELFWELIESWARENPPNTGPHWKCGQEISLRLMAWMFGLFAFLDSPATTAKRFASFVGWVGAQADRVAKDLTYSHLQHSNHAVSEGLGLFLVGTLFPQLRSAQSWAARGQQILEERASFLIRPDGTYLQKSHNYLRFILHAYLYALRVAEANGRSFAPAMLARIRSAYDYLYSVFDQKSGRVPNFGSNDGALIFQASSADFRDFRPILGSLHYYFERSSLFEPGPWSEEQLWFFGPDAVAEPKEAERSIPSRSFDTGGIYTIRSDASWAMIHAETFTDRPAHADCLHLDLWWKGINIAPDSGTYLYYGRQPWNDPYRHTAAHNTIVVDGRDQMDRGLRFTWTNWHSCRVNHRGGGTPEPFEWIEFEHDGYARLDDPAIHKRAVVRIRSDNWIVVDDIVGMRKNAKRSVHSVCLNWTFPNVPFHSSRQGEYQLQTPAGAFSVSIHGSDESTEFDLVIGGDKTGVRGFVSEYYAHKQPAISLHSTMHASLPLRFVTVFCAGSPQRLAEFDGCLLRVDDVDITLGPIGEPSGIVQSIAPISANSTTDSDKSSDRRS